MSIQSGLRAIRDCGLLVFAAFLIFLYFDSSLLSSSSLSSVLLDVVADTFVVWFPLAGSSPAFVEQKPPF